MNIRGPVQTFLDIFNAASVLVDEAHIEKTADSLNFRGMDPSHIAMLDISYPAIEFEAFEGEIKLGIRTQEITKILKRFDKKSSVSLSVADSMLILSDGQRTFRNRLIEASASSTPIPKLTFETRIDTDKAMLSQVFDDVGAVSEFIQFNAKEVFGRGDSGEVSLKPEWNVVGEDKATYSLDYLSKMLKAVNADKITLEYGSKKPCRLTMGFISYYLAPRVQD